jgi:hypothetical protein
VFTALAADDVVVEITFVVVVGITVVLLLGSITPGRRLKRDTVFSELRRRSFDITSMAADGSITIAMRMLRRTGWVRYCFTEKRGEGGISPDMSNFDLIYLSFISQFFF